MVSSHSLSCEPVSGGTRWGSSHTELPTLNDWPGEGKQPISPPGCKMVFILLSNCSILYMHKQSKKSFHLLLLRVLRKVVFPFHRNLATPKIVLMEKKGFTFIQFFFVTFDSCCYWDWGLLHKFVVLFYKNSYLQLFILPLHSVFLSFCVLSGEYSGYCGSHEVSYAAPGSELWQSHPVCLYDVQWDGLLHQFFWCPYIPESGTACARCVWALVWVFFQNTAEERYSWGGIFYLLWRSCSIISKSACFYQTLIYRQVRTALNYDFRRVWFCAALWLSCVFVFPKRQNSRNRHLLVTNWPRTQEVQPRSMTWSGTLPIPPWWLCACPMAASLSCRSQTLWRSLPHSHPLLLSHLVSGSLGGHSECWTLKSRHWLRGV